MKANSFLALLIVFAISSAGCSFLTKPENQPIAKITVQFATLKYIEQAGDKDAQIARAQRIKSIAADVQSLVKSDEQSTIPALDTLVRSKVPWDKLSPADTILATNLIDVIEAELMRRLGVSGQPGVLSPDQMIVISDMVNWVSEAATLGGAQ